MIDYKSVRLFGTLAALAATAAFSASAANFTAIVAFGDSYTDTGRSPSSPPDYYDGRFSNGPLWIEYLSQTLGFDYNADNNYAVSGTESDELGVAIAKFPGTSDSSGVLFAIWSGNNDFQGHLDEGVNDTYWNGSVTHTVSSLTNSCALLYAKGARNVVLFNQIDITKLPMFLESYSTDYGAYIRGKINDVNSQLQNALGPLLAANPGLQIYVVDAYDDFNALLANYAAYGFTDDTIGAINDPNLANISFDGPGANYVFWDDQHPTTKTHNLISGWVANTLGNGSASDGVSDLTVEIQGRGSVSPNYNGKLLKVGKIYGMTAMPAAGFAFTGWTESGAALTRLPHLSFTMNSGLTLVATFVDVGRPTVTVNALPAAVTQPTLLVRGTAHDNVGVAGVFCQVNGQGWNPVSSANGFANWSATLQLSGGLNALQFYSVDSSGNKSRTNNVSVRYIVIDPLTLAITGAGKVTGVFNGDPLVVGRSYSATAVPAAKNLFSSWTVTGSGGSVISTGNPLTFVMDSDTLLTANFVTNNFLKAVGNYNGLFSVGATGVTEETSGQFRNFTVSSLGVFSGRLFIAGMNYALSGRFHVDGSASVTVPRPRPAGPLLLQLTLNWDASPSQLTGSVSGTNGGYWSADLTAELAGNELPSGAFTMLLPPQSAESGTAPTGYGYAAIANHNGAVTLSGALADGRVFSQFAAASTTGDVPVYVSLYNHTGLLLGWINLANASSGGNLVWIKPNTRTAGVNWEGFTSSIQAVLSPWTRPTAGQAAIPLSDGQLTISGPDGQAPQLSFSVEVNTKNQLIKLADGSPANLLNGSINPQTGVWTIAFGNGTGRTTTQGRGVFLQNTADAGGFFTDATGVGSIILSPTTP